MDQKSKINCLPLHVHVVLGFELQALHLVLIPRVDLLHFERKSRTDLLHVDAVVALLEDVAVVSEEDEVSLVVESDHSSAPELRILREERGQHPAHPHSHLRVEIIQNQLRNVLRSYRMVPYILLELHTGNFKDSQHAFQVSDQQFPPIGVPDHHHMREVQVLSVGVDLLQLHVSARVVGHVVEHHHQLPQQFVDLDRRLQRCRHQNLHRPVVIEDLVELVEHRFVVLLHILLASLLLILDSDRFLPFRSGQFLPLLPLLHLDLVLDDAALVVDLLSFLLVLDLVRLLLEGRGELLHGLGPHPHRLGFGLLVSQNLLVGLRLLLLCHC